MKIGPGLRHGLAQSAQSGYFIVQLPGTSCACVQSGPNSPSAASAPAAQPAALRLQSSSTAPALRVAGFYAHRYIRLKGKQKDHTNKEAGYTNGPFH